MALKTIDNPNDVADSYQYKHQSTLATRHEAADKAVDPTFDKDSSCDLKTPTRERGCKGVKTRREMASWAGQPSVKGSSETMRMMLLTFSLVGLQYVYLLNWVEEDLADGDLDLLGELK